MWTIQKTRQRADETRRLRAVRARRSSRRGVLMLVVLSMLVLFMLIGTAFLMSSSQEQKTATAAAKNNRVGNYGTKLLDRALLQVVRDTENPYSVIHYHSLLRDLYGTNGIQGVIYSPSTGSVDPTKAAGQVTRYAGAIAGARQHSWGRRMVSSSTCMFASLVGIQLQIYRSTIRKLRLLRTLELGPYYSPTSGIFSNSTVIHWGRGNCFLCRSRKVISTVSC